MNWTDKQQLEQINTEPFDLKGMVERFVKGREKNG